MQAKEAFSSQQSEEVDSYRHKAETLESELSKRLEDVALLESEVRRLTSTYEELYLSKGADSALRVEVEQLQRENQRLMGMLKGTREY